MATDSVNLILCVMSCMVAFGASAAVYKWVDEQGVTQYGEKPPPGQKAQALQIRPAPPSPAAPTVKDGEKDKPAAGWQDQAHEFQRRRVERLEQERKEQEREARVRAESKEKCIEARYDLDTLSKAVPVYRLDEKGERKYYDDKEREAIIARAKKNMATYCRS